MGKTEIILVLTIITVIIFTFIAGVLLFVFQYRKRKLLHEKEKAAIEKQHKLDLLNNLLRIQQQTMQFIGSEIHDSVAQKLTLASIYTQKLEFENKYPGLPDKLGKISSIINDSLSELRDLAKTLTNSNLQDKGLTELLLHEKERVDGAGICGVRVKSDFNREMSITVKSFLLRVIQEFIQNSLKHSGCSQIKIVLADEPGGLSVNVSDDGKGFDIDNLHSDGIGLNNMKRRIHMVGGEFDLQSEPGKGTSLQMFIDNKNLLSE
ncbi:MAG: ATP-binding protein [Ferruginibacter sp.]